MTAKILDLKPRLAQAEEPCPCPADRLSRLSALLRDQLKAADGALLLPAPDVTEALREVLAVVDAVLNDYPPHQRLERTTEC